MKTSIILLLTLFNLIAFWSSLLAIRFWLGIYDRAKHGSIAWLLFGIVSVYMLSVALFPHIILHFTTLDLKTKYWISANYIIFWSAVYTSFFAAAGYVLYKALITYPKEKLGKLLIEGLRTEESKEKTKLDIKKEYFISDLLKGKTLIKYSHKDCYENAVIELILRFWGELRNVVLITSYPKNLVYEEKLSDLLKIGAIKIVNLKVTEECVSANNNIINSSIYNLSSLQKALHNLPEGCVLIVELSKLRLLEIPDAEKLLNLPYDTIAFINHELGQTDAKGFNRVGEVVEEGIKLNGKIIGLVVGKRFYLQN